MYTAIEAPLSCQKNYLTTRGIATSRSTLYHPTGNSQCKRINQTVWKIVKLFLRNYELPQKAWESVSPEALHSVRSLLCSTINSTPHERFLGFGRRSMIGRALPSWRVQPGPVLLRRFVRNKNDPYVDEVEFLEANPNFTQVHFPDGRESTVSVSDLAPCPKTNKDTSKDSDSLSLESQENVTSAQCESNATADDPLLFNSDSSTNASKS